MKNPKFIALGFIVVLGLWLLSGVFTGASTDEAELAAGISDVPSRPMLTVRVREQVAQTVSQTAAFSGKTEPARSVTLKAETGGRIDAVPARRGGRLLAGEPILSIEALDRTDQLNQARALVEQRKLEFEAAQSLADKGYQAETALAQARTQLLVAEALVRTIREDLENTQVAAPFDGFLLDRFVEDGDYVMAGDPVAEFIELNPIVIAGTVTEKNVTSIHPGSRGFAVLRNSGPSLEGTVRYVAPGGDAVSRTFRVELECPNPDGMIRAGITCDVHIPIGEVLAHRLSPALLSLNEDGILGIKAVDPGNRVVFYPVELVKADTDYVWLSGLPESFDLIVVGQGFAKEGDVVKPVKESLTDISGEPVATLKPSGR